MNHLGTKTLETERLILRKFTLEDAEDMFNNWASDDEVTKYLTWPTYKNMDDAKGYIQFLLDKYDNKATYDWCIQLKETDDVIGSMGIVGSNEAASSVHIGYCIGRSWWNKGITSEALSAVIKYFMEEVNINRIESRHDTNNPNSGKVMEKCGLKYEGTLRESDSNNQGICDAAYYGLLRREYFNR